MIRQRRSRFGEGFELQKVSFVVDSAFCFLDIWSRKRRRKLDEIFLFNVKFGMSVTMYKSWTIREQQQSSAFLVQSTNIVIVMKS
jgi:hypothetical protein